MTELRKRIDEAVRVLCTRTKMQPSIGIILGTGLGGLADEIHKETVVDYGEIPHFPISTVESHQGKLIFGTLGGKSVVAMQGRFHFYEMDVLRVLRCGEALLLAGLPVVVEKIQALARSYHILS